MGGMTSSMPPGRPETDVEVLRALDAAPYPGLKTLAKRIDLNVSTVRRTLRRLVAQDLATWSPGDGGRVGAAAITSAGRRRLTSEELAAPDEAPRAREIAARLDALAQEARALAAEVRRMA